MRFLTSSAAGILGLLCCWASIAQTAPTWSAPSSGYVYDSAAGEILPVSGYIGAAIAGAPILSSVTWASLAPNEKSAIVAHSGQVELIADLRSPNLGQALDRNLSPRQLFWSNDSSSAVALTQDDEVVWLANLGASPYTSSRWQLDNVAERGAIRDAGRTSQTSAPRSAWWILAVDSAAQTALLTRRTGAHTGLYVATPDAAPTVIAFDGDPVAAAFSPSAPTAFIADAASLQISAIRNITTNPTISVFVAQNAFAKNPVGVALSDSGDRIFAVDREAPTIEVFDSATGASLGEVPTGGAISALIPFAPGLVLLSPVGNGKQPFYFLETSNPPQVVFVPREQ
jgi:DNA-binding beta-propeller fold protein YncE